MSKPKRRKVRVPAKDLRKPLAKSLLSRGSRQRG